MTCAHCKLPSACSITRCRMLCHKVACRWEHMASAQLPCILHALCHCPNVPRAPASYTLMHKAGTQCQHVTPCDRMQPEPSLQKQAAGTTSPPHNSTPAHHMIPDMATQTPSSFLGGISSPKKMQPPVKMSTVLMWPTTLYVRLLVQPITRKVDRLTSRPSRALMMIAATAIGVYLQKRSEVASPIRHRISHAQCQRAMQNSQMDQQADIGAQALRVQADTTAARHASAQPLDHS